MLNDCRLAFINSSILDWCRGVRKPVVKGSYTPLPLRVEHTRISPMLLVAHCDRRKIIIEWVDINNIQEEDVRCRTGLIIM